MLIKEIFIHCADTPNNREVNAEEIHRWHRERGFDGIGYHAVILRNGLVERGRPEYWSGAHVKGHNSNSLGVCLIGRDQFTDQQIESLKAVLRDWKIKYPDAEIKGHREVDEGKVCPGFDVQHWLQTGELK